MLPRKTRKKRAGSSRHVLQYGVRKGRQLKLLSKNRQWSSHPWGYQGDVLFFRFSIHPGTGEFVGGEYGSGQHAGQIGILGSYPFDEYVRLVYTSKDPDHSVLLTRPYYSPEETAGEYKSSVDRERQLQVLALLVINGLPNDTAVSLSENRSTFRYYGVD